MLKIEGFWLTYSANSRLNNTTTLPDKITGSESDRLVVNPRLKGVGADAWQYSRAIAKPGILEKNSTLPMSTKVEKFKPIGEKALARKPLFIKGFCFNSSRAERSDSGINRRCGTQANAYHRRI